MAKTTDWGETKQNQTIRITPTSKLGLQTLAKSLDLSMNELIERFGRASQDSTMGEILHQTALATIAQMQNIRKSRKLQSKNE